MKRVILAVVALMFAGAVSAQNYMVVDSERVFKSLATYNNALTEIEELSAEYQQLVDNRFQQVETMYNNYISRRQTMSESARQQQEQAILAAEAEATEYQESLFGTDGELMNRRLALIQPIQEQVFNTIERFAQQNGYDLVIDISANPTILYYSTSVDFTDRIIQALR